MSMKERLKTDFHKKKQINKLFVNTVLYEEYFGKKSSFGAILKNFIVKHQILDFNERMTIENVNLLTFDVSVPVTWLCSTS